MKRRTLLGAIAVTWMAARIPTAFGQGRPAEAPSDTPPPVGPDGKPLLETLPPKEMTTTNIRGEVVSVSSPLTVKTKHGKALRLEMGENTPVFVLTPASYTQVDFGTYVGSVSYKLGEEIYSPIVRDSLSWLHRGYELRIVDESLRGIAVGHTKWDLTNASVMTHGWVDDMEGRVISIKYGPTEAEETDVEVARDTPVVRMALGDRSLIKPGAEFFAGGKVEGDRMLCEFVFVGEDGARPGL